MNSLPSSPHRQLRYTFKHYPLNPIDLPSQHLPFPLPVNNLFTTSIDHPNILRVPSFSPTFPTLYSPKDAHYPLSPFPHSPFSPSSSSSSSSDILHQQQEENFEERKEKKGFRGEGESIDLYPYVFGFSRLLCLGVGHLNNTERERDENNQNAK